MREYATRVLSALALDRPAESIDAVKDVVAQELLQLDRRARIVRTDYFNHSYTPDFVLEWPDTENGRRHRHVYLRFQSQRSVLLQDVNLLGDQSPIVFGLGEVQETADDDAQTLRESAASTNSLVTDSDGIERVLEARDESPFMKVVSSAFGKAGRGLLDEEGADRIASSLEAGFTGARSLDSETTASATAVIDEVLREDYANPFVGFLRAVWIGNGGDPSQFPIDHHASAHLPDEALQFLLDMEEIGDEDFWWQVGAKITLEQLGRVRLEGISTNLQHLIRVAHPVLTAKLCKVLADQPRLNDEQPALYWVIERGLLALRGVDFSAYLAPRQEAMTVQGEDRKGITLKVLQERTDKYRVPVGQFQLAREDRNIAYGSDTAPDVIHDSEVGLLAEALGPTAFVQRAEARLPEGRVLQLDFKSLTSSGRTAAQFPIREILFPSLALLWSMTPSDHALLENLLPSIVQDSGQTRLKLDEGQVHARGV